MDIVLLLIVLVLLVGWYFLRRRYVSNPPPAPNTVRRSSKPDNAYHAVSIKFASNACMAAKDLAGTRFLSNEAPMLPLPECNVNNCECHFAHHPDRRTGKDRRSPFTPSGFSASTGNFEQERREDDRRRGRDDDLY